MTVQQDSREIISPTGCPVSGMAAGFDPFRGAYQVDPSSSLREARAEEPVFYSPELDYWVVTRYEDVKRVFKSPEEFSASIALEPITPVSGEAMEILGKYGYVPDSSLVNEDDASVHRRLLSEPFGADNVATLEPRIREVVNSYLDRVIRAGKADLIDDLLYEVPCIIALMFLGAPDEDIEKIRNLAVSQALFTWGRPDGDEQTQVADTFGRYWQFTGELLAKVKADPNRTGWMAHIFDMQREHPDLFSDNYVQNLVMGGIFAAHETTTNATGNAFRTLLENRTAWDEICTDPDLIPKAVEECLRHSGSVVAWRRRAVDDTTVGGVEIPAGGKLLLVTSSANRDDDVFPAPDEFDIQRGNARRHLTFGIGVHTCLGATLARLEMKVFLGEVSRRLPHMRLVEGQEFRYLPNTSFRGPEHLLVEWDPTANPVAADRP